MKKKQNKSKLKFLFEVAILGFSLAARTSYFGYELGSLYHRMIQWHGYGNNIKVLELGGIKIRSFSLK